MRLSYSIFTIALLLLSATASLAKEVIVADGVHPVCDNIKYASTDVNHHKKAYDKNYRNAASEAYVYALMASNVYEQYATSKPKFEIPGWRQESEKITTWRGLGAHIYVKEPLENIVAVVFEGTNADSWRDWLFGNLNIYWLGQYAEADALVDRVIEDHPTAQIITAGHSLGGGLAIHTALTHQNISTFAFNASPRVFIPDDFEGQGSEIMLISENDDILQSLRKTWGSLDALKLAGPYEEFDFLDLATNNDDKLTEHGMYIIARGLMLVAAGNESQHAINMINNLNGSSSACKPSH